MSTAVEISGLSEVEKTHRSDLARSVKGTPKPKGTRIEKIRKIVNEHQASRIEGLLVDSFTASMLVVIHDALRPDLQEKFCAFPLRQMVDIGWKLYKKYGK